MSLPDRLWCPECGCTAQADLFPDGKIYIYCDDYECAYTYSWEDPL